MSEPFGWIVVFGYKYEAVSADVLELHLLWRESQVLSDEIMDKAKLENPGFDYYFQVQAPTPGK